VPYTTKNSLVLLRDLIGVPCTSRKSLVGVRFCLKALLVLRNLGESLLLLRILGGVPYTTKGSLVLLRILTECLVGTSLLSNLVLNIYLKE
jgi:hypothetical protein